VPTKCVTHKEGHQGRDHDDGNVDAEDDGAEEVVPLAEPLGDLRAPVALIGEVPKVWTAHSQQGSLSQRQHEDCRNAQKHQCATGNQEWVSHAEPASPQQLWR